MTNDLHAEWVAYTGKVYGFCVPPHHLIRTRRNGKEQWTGNSGRDVGGYTAEGQPSRGGKRGGKKMCFPAHQLIRTLHGEEKIGHIVEQRKPVLVWACDDGGQWGYHRVVNWFVRAGNVDEVLTVEVYGAFSDSAACRTHRRCFYPTKNHEVYLYDGTKVPAGCLKPGDKLTSFGYVPTQHQWSILLGSMLGDGCVCNAHKPDDAAFHEMHSEKQKDYLDWKADCLNLLMTNGSRTTTAANVATVDGKMQKAPGEKRVRYIVIGRQDVAHELSQLFYDGSGEKVCDGGGKKRLLRNVLSRIDDLAVAVWLLDDGYIGNRSKKAGQVHLQGSIAAMGFDAQDTAALAEFLSSRYGVATPVREDRSIYLPADICWKLVDVISRWVPYTAVPQTKRWLREEVRRRQKECLPVPLNTMCSLGNIPVTVRSIQSYQAMHPTAKSTGKLPLYDIEVAGVHRYCASNIVVSNSGFDVSALLAHGATEVLKDSHLVRGTRNEDYWNALRLGRPLPEPTIPFIYDKFVNTLKAGGINVVKKGDIVSIMPLTDSDTEQLSSGEIQNSDQVESKNLEPLKGGLFDPTLTGGLNGDKFTHVTLAEPLPNPVMEEAIRRLLGLRVQDYLAVLAGRQSIDGLSGGKGIERALRKIDVPQRLEELKATVMNARGQKRDDAVKALRYLHGAQKQGINPGDWVITKVPILPPKFRPVSVVGDMIRAADMNGLYRDLIETNNGIKELRGQVAETDLADEKVQLYQAVQAAFGVGDPITPEGESKRWHGAIRQVIGSSPKFGMFNSKVLSKTVDVVGRGVITPDPNLDMDQLGIPEDKAWELYRPFILRRLVRRGFPPVKAAQLVEKRTKEAEDELQREMEDRPVIMDRAPTWHKFNLLAFRPHVVKEDVLRVSPLITAGYNADFDGDQQLSALIFVINENFLALSVDNQLYKAIMARVQQTEVTMYTKAVVPLQEGEHAYMADLADVVHAEHPEFVSKTTGAAFFVPVPGLRVLAYDEENQRVVSASVTYWSQHLPHEVVVVTLSSGRQIFTDDDPRAIYALEPGTLMLKRFTPKAASTAGVLVPRVERLSRFKTQATRTTLPVPGSCQPTPGVRGNVARIRLVDEVVLDRGFGYFLGCLVGDGWVASCGGTPKGLCLAGAAEEVFSRWTTEAGRLFVNSADCHVGRVEMPCDTNRYGNCSRLTLSVTGLGEFVLPLIGKTAGGKHLPVFYASAPRDFQLGLLEGIFDTDGTICRVQARSKTKPQTQAAISTNSLRLARELQHLCRLLGARSRISSTKTPAGNSSWVLSISVADLCDLKLQLSCSNKQAALAGVAGRRGELVPPMTDRVPISPDFAKAVAGLLHPKCANPLYVQLRKAIRCGYISRTKAAESVMAAGPDFEHPQLAVMKALIANTDIAWESIESVDYTGIQEPGFDLTVPGYETFMNVDGVILSNTVNFHVPVTTKAAAEALEKMLPSKNLFRITDLKSVMHAPGKEMVMGLYQLTRDPAAKKPVTFKNARDAKKAYEQGLIGANDPIVIQGD